MIMIPEFMRFYNYTTIDSVMNENARTFFALMNQMYRLQAKESLNLLQTVGAAFSGGSDYQSVKDALIKQAKGLHGILQEVNLIKKIRKNK